MIRRYFVAVFIATLCFFYTLSLHAAEEANALSRLTTSLIEILAAVLMVVLPWLAYKGIRLFEQKTKFDIPDKIEARIDKLVRDAVAFAEEQGHKVVKNKLPDLPDKLEMAIGFALDLKDKYGVDELAQEKLVKLIESKLHQQRAWSNNTENKK